jgi:Stress responsive A/B Barrel Domain
VQIRHFVAFKFVPYTSESDRNSLVHDFNALPKLVSGITHFECGVNISPENLNKEFTHVFLMTFKDAVARDLYLVHPAHQMFVEKYKPLLADALVLDFEIDT